MTESAIVNEWMESTRIESVRETLFRFVRGLWRNAVTSETAKLISNQTSMQTLNDWVDRAAEATDFAQFEASLRGIQR